MEMKKSILLLTGSALLLAGCAKVENEVVVPESTMKHVVLKATVNEADTRVSADAAGSFSWQAGDEIAVYTDKGSVAKFTAANGGATADFEGDLPSDAGFGSYAFYPYADNFAAPSPDDHIVFTLGGVHNFVQDATNMPMMGAITDEGVTFEAVGGVLKLIVYNVPQGANEFRFVSTGGKKIAGNFTVTNGAIVTENAVGAVEDTQKFLFQRPESGNMVFYIPLPTGTIGAFKVEFYEADNENPVYEKTANANLTVGRNKLIVAPALNAAPATNIVLWSEDFSQYAKDNVPSGNQGVGYNDAVINYSVSNGGSTTKIYEETLAGGTSPELLVSKTNGSFTASNIPTAGATSAVLSFLTNKNTIKVSSSTDGVTITEASGSYSVSISSTVTSFNLTIKNTGSQNARIDNILLEAVVGTAPTVPTISVGKESVTIAEGNLSASIDGVKITNPLDDLGIIATTDADWLDLAFEGNSSFEVGKKLRATAKSFNTNNESRTAIVTLKATGATKTVSFVQNPSVVDNPTLIATAGNATFSVSWTGDSRVASYIGYYSNTILENPTTGIALTINNSETAYTAAPSQAVVNGTKYYVYVKVETITAEEEENWGIATGWATAEVTPFDPDAKTVISIDFTTTTQRPQGFPSSSGNGAGTSLATYSIAGYDFTFCPSSGNSYYWIVANTNKYLFIGKQGAYIQFPAISGKALTKVQFHTSGTNSTKVIPGLYSADGKTEIYKPSSSLSADTDYEWTLTGTSANASYRFQVTNSYNIQLTNLELTYE